MGNCNEFYGSTLSLSCERCGEGRSAHKYKPCPSCARVEDVEGLAKVIFESETEKTIEWSDNLGDWLRKNYLNHARAVSAWIKEGK